MRKNDLGFTFLELGIIILVLAILTAITIPKFFDLMADAKIRATNAVATSLTTANTANYTLRKKSPKKGISVSNCQDISKTSSDALKPGYAIVSQKINMNETATCHLTGPNSTTATFTATGIK